MRLAYVFVPGLLGVFLASSVAGCDSSTSDSGSIVPPAEAGTPEDGGTPSADASVVLTPCPAAPSGPGTTHDKEIATDETWTAAASPHRVTFNIRTLATLTIEPCATVLLGDGYGITVGKSDGKGTLVAKGQRGVDASGAPLQRAVTFAAADPAKPWGSIFVVPGSLVDLEAAVLSDGASPASDQNGGGTIVAYGLASNGPDIVANVRVKDVTIERSRGYGINFQSLSAFTADSSGLTIKNGGRAGTFPVRLGPGAVGSLPSGLTVTGNTADEIEIYADNTAMASDTIRARGVPYRVSGRIRVAPDKDGAPSKLTIEPGVTLRFDDNLSASGVQVGTSDTRQGFLFAEGTAAAPITFTSAKATPAPADWANVYFAYSPASGNRIAHAVIEYAGGPSGAQGYGCGPAENDASVLILSARPTDAFIQNTTLKNGGGDTGILLGWVSDASGPDFVATNTFTSMPACHVSRWRSATGEACPGSTGGSAVCF